MEGRGVPHLRYLQLMMKMQNTQINTLQTDKQTTFLFFQLLVHTESVT